MSKNELFDKVFSARSKEKFLDGLRSPIDRINPALRPVARALLSRFGVQENVPFLLSTYVGGMVLTITTEHACYLVETEQLSPAEQAIIKSAHGSGSIVVRSF